MPRYEDNENEVERARTPRLRVTDLKGNVIQEIIDDEYFDDDTGKKVQQHFKLQNPSPALGEFGLEYLNDFLQANPDATIQTDLRRLLAGDF